MSTRAENECLMRWLVFLAGLGFRALAFACALLGMPSPASGSLTQGEARRSAADVVLVVMDDVGYLDLEEVRGSGFAPTLDALAGSGFVFQRAFSNPVCSPTRRSLYFNEWRVEQSGPVCGAPDSSAPLPEQVSLAEQLPDHESLFLGKWHVGSSARWQETPQSHGWDAWRAGVPFYVAGNPQTTCGGYDYTNWVCVEDGIERQVFGTYQPALMTQRFAEWWPSVAGNRFCVFSTQLAHEPYHRPPKAWLPSGYPGTPTDRKKYLSMIAALDGQLAKLLDRVDLARTVLVIVGDNGTPKSIAPDPTRAKTTTFERGIHVPMILVGAGVPKGRSDALVHVVDLHPTIVELAGGRVRAGIGASLVPLMKGTANSVHDFILSGIRGDPQFTDDVCARSLRYKLRRTPAGEEFYDLRVDPGELQNRIADPQLAAEVAAHRAWLDSTLP